MSRKRIQIKAAPSKGSSPKAAKTGLAGAKPKTAAPEARAADHRMTALRGTGVPAKRLPGPGAEGVESIPLPWRERLEARLGRSLGHLEVLTGPAVASALASLGATAATRGQRIYLPEATADFSTVAHEVVHSLQAVADPAAGPPEHLQEAAASAPDAESRATESRVVEADAPAELEAARVAESLATEDAGSASPALEQSLEPGDVALLRVTDPSSDPAARLDRAVSETSSESSSSAPAQAQAKADAPAAETAEPASGEATTEPAPELEPSPTFDLPEMPATELSADELAARQAEQAQALAAIDGAEGASGVVDAFAEAPPSVKALAQGSLSGKIDGAVGKEETDFTAGIPEFHAEMGGTPLGEEEGAPPVAAPEIGEVQLEEDTPAPDQQPELPPTEAIGKFLANNAVVSFFSNLFGGGSAAEDDREQRAEAIGKSLNKVETSDPEIGTSPGEKPEVALEGETDPQRIEDQKGAGREQARGARNDAATAVIEGPGPEKAQLKSMDEVKTVGELKQPQLEGVASAQGAEKFQALAMPEEVNAQFDADMHGSMHDSMSEARGAMESAETERDASRDQALAQAESDRQSLVEKADGDQRDEVLEARKTIQTERQATLDAQADGVRDLETQAEKESRANSKKIKTRVKEDEGKISKRYDSAESEAETELKKGEKDAEAERKKSEEASNKRSWWDRLKSWVKEQFAKLTAAIGKIFDAVRALVKKALDAARNFAKGLIDAVASFIKDAIAVFGEMLKGLVNTLLSDLFPDLARKLNEKIDSAVTKAQKAVDKVADDLKKGVDAVVDALQAGLDAILDVFQAAINLGLAVLAAAITGDWGEVARMLLEAALKVVGIEPAAFYAFVGKVMDVIGLIVDAPGTFLMNCVNAVVQGFEGFADNFLQHLKGGIIAWLTGALGDLQIPEKFDFFGVLDLGRQVMGLTWEWLKKKAALVVGEENVERLDYVLDYVETVREDGWIGLFERIRDELTGLAGLVLGQIKEFLVTKLLMAAVSWIASLFSPVGAIVKLLFTVWNLFLFLKDQLMRIAAIVKSVVASISDIAHGVLGDAADKVEGALAKFLPVAIDLVMKLLGITGVSQRVRKVIQDIRERIDKAADKLIHKAMKLFKPKKKQAGENKSDAGEDAADVHDAQQDPAADGRKPGALGAGSDGVTLGGEMTFAGGGEEHTLFIDVSGQNANVMMHSQERTVASWLTQLQGQVDNKAETKGWAPEEKQEIADALSTAIRLHGELDNVADKRLTIERKDPADLKVQIAEGLAKPKRKPRSKPKATGRKKKGKKKKKKGPSIFDKQRDLRAALEKVLVAFHGEVGKIPLQKRFAKHILKVDEDFFRGYLVNHILEPNNEAWSFLRTWDEVVTQSIKTAKPFQVSPFNTRHSRNQAFRKLIDPEIKARVKKKADQLWKDTKSKEENKGNAKLKGRFSVKKRTEILGTLDEFVSRRVIQSAIANDPSVPIDQIRRSWFQPIDPEATVDLIDDHIDQALSQRFTEYVTGTGVSPEIKKNIKASTVVDFLKAMADKQDYEKISWQSFYDYWTNPSDRRHISTQFRNADKTKHEWIAMEITDRVINTARSAQATAAGAIWVTYQNKLRSPTKSLIFKPNPSNAEHFREVSYRDTGSFTPTKDRPDSRVSKTQKVLVLQGHPGAVYAPVDDDGYRADAIDQSKGFMGWHDTFNESISKKVPGSQDYTLVDIQNIVKQVGETFKDTIWNPARKKLAKPRFEFYFSGKGKSASQVDYAKVEKDQADAYKAEYKRLTGPADKLLS